MKNSFCFLLALVSVIFFSCGQSGDRTSSSTGGINKIDPKDSLICIVPLPTSYDLVPEDVPVLDSVHQLWLKESFYPVLEKYKLIQDCQSCGDIYLTLCLDVDSSGKAYNGTICNAEVDCKKKKEEMTTALAESIAKKEPFTDIILPQVYWGKKIRLRFGRATKC